MGLLANIEPVRVARCAVGRALDQADTDDRKVIAGWFADDDIPAAWIGSQLSEAFDIKVPRGAAVRHRNGECSCGKD